MVTAIIGAQYGSEGKGVITAHIANDYNTHVRVGAPNAGHTMMWGGEKWKMQTIPCGWVNPAARLVIGAGALIDIDLMVNEIIAIEEKGYSIRDRLYVDNRAGIILEQHADWEGGVEGEPHKRIGSTGKGVGAARIAKISRSVLLEIPWETAAERLDLLDWCTVCDTTEILQDDRKQILLEGAQGVGLSLTHGEWPYCTSADTGVAQLLSDTGIPPASLGDTIFVVRSFPIRVAGNSGPLKYEMTWADLDQEPEYTTVTNKQRRIGGFDSDQVQRAIKLNSNGRGDRCMALTFLDYVFGVDRGKAKWEDLSVPAQNYITMMEEQLDTRIDYIGTGGPNLAVIEKW